MPERFLKKLGNHYARILVDARWVAFTFGGRADHEEVLMQRARDLIHEVAYRVIDGRRTWVEDIDFRVFMKMAMKSVAFGEWKRARRFESTDQQPVAEDGAELPKKELQDPDPHPLESALEEQEAEARVYELLEAAEDDPILKRVIDAYLENDCERPRHVATRLGMTEKDVYQAQRKLERRVTARRKKVNS